MYNRVTIADNTGSYNWNFPREWNLNVLPYIYLKYIYIKICEVMAVLVK